MAITDLTNTTWVVPAGWSATAGYGRFGDIVYTIDEHAGTQYQYLYVGYNGNFDNNFSTPTANVIVLGYYGQFYNKNGFTITFTGGTDVTNPSLISWIEANGECQNPPASEGVTIKYKDTTIPVEAGQTVTLNTAGQKLTEDMVISVPKESGGGTGATVYSIDWDTSDLTSVACLDILFLPSSICEGQTVAGVIFAGQINVNASNCDIHEKTVTIPSYYQGYSGTLTVIEVSNPTGDINIVVAQSHGGGSN